VKYRAARVLNSPRETGRISGMLRSFQIAPEVHSGLRYPIESARLEPLLQGA